MRPYDQQPDESVAAYRRFLFYRNLGPTRTMEAAYQASLGDEAKKGDGRQQIPGNWSRDSARYRWAERATIWDIDHLNAVGEETAVALVQTIRRYTAVVLESLDDIHPKKFDDITRALELLAKLFPPEAIGSLIQSHQRRGDDESV